MCIRDRYCGQCIPANNFDIIFYVRYKSEEISPDLFDQICPKNDLTMTLACQILLLVNLQKFGD